jgi:virulence-associated protein VagC
MSHQRLFVLFVLISAGAQAQWLNFPTPGTPRARDGKPNLTAPAPRTADGKPDLSGVWRTELTPPGESLLGNESYFVVPGDDPRTFSKYFWNILADFKAAEAPMRPEAAELFRKNRTSAITPSSSCLPLGIPGSDLLSSGPFKIIQTRGETVVLYEADNTHRQIYTDGRKLPVDPNPAWLGYSVGHWEGDTFVVDSAGFNDRGRLDGFGHPRSEALRLRERFHRRDFGHMDLEVTVADTKLYLKPITVKVRELLDPDGDVLESFCNENEKDRTHLEKH